jgi:glycosyltransferase involved in cell wall biosynthesis
MKMNAKRISIITPSLNRARMLESAVQSVLAQGYSNYEHIILDALSTDGTAELVAKYPHIHFFSESDHGMYDALNKGIERSTGEIIGFLNTDDLYPKDIFFEVAEGFADAQVMAVAGRAIVLERLLEEEPVVVEEYSPDHKSLLEDSTIGSNYFNAWFFHRSVFEKIGGFNIDYRIIGDREFMLRFALNGLNYVTIDKVTYHYYQHAGSLTFDKAGQKLEQSALEHLKMTDSYLPDSNLSGQARKLLIRLRTRNSVEMAARSLGTLKAKDFIFYVVDGTEHDIAWIPEFLGFVFRQIVKIFSKRK